MTNGYQEYLDLLKDAYPYWDEPDARFYVALAVLIEHRAGKPAEAMINNSVAAMLDAPVEDVKRAKALAYLDAHEYVQEIGIDAFTEKVRKGLSAASAPN